MFASVHYASKSTSKYLSQVDHSNPPLFCQVFNLHPLLANYCHEEKFLQSLPLIAEELGIVVGDGTDGLDMADNVTALDGGNETASLLPG